MAIGSSYSLPMTIFPGTYRPPTIRIRMTLWLAKVSIPKTTGKYQESMTCKGRMRLTKTARVTMAKVLNDQETFTMPAEKLVTQENTLNRHRRKRVTRIMASLPRTQMLPAQVRVDSPAALPQTPYPLVGARFSEKLPVRAGTPRWKGGGV